MHKRKHRTVKVWKRSGRFNRHHIVNESRGGKANGTNLLIMDTMRHEAWHLLFKNLDFQEVIELLKRTLRAKKNS